MSHYSEAEFRKAMGQHLIGKTIRVDRMEDEPQYDGRIGVVEFVDAIGQLHGTWGGLAVAPGIDAFTVLKDGEVGE